MHRATACRVLCCCGCRMNWCRCCAATGGDRQPSACSARSAAAAARLRSKQTPPHLRRHLRCLHPLRPTASQSEAWSQVCAVHRTCALQCRQPSYLQQASDMCSTSCCDSAIIGHLKPCLKLSLQSVLQPLGFVRLHVAAVESDICKQCYRMGCRHMAWPILRNTVSHVSQRQLLPNKAPLARTTTYGFPTIVQQGPAPPLEHPKGFRQMCQNPKAACNLLKTRCVSCVPKNAPMTYSRFGRAV